MAGVVGFEPTVHGIKTREIILIFLTFLMRLQENHEKCCQRCSQILRFYMYF